MNRFATILVILLLSTPAFAQGPRKLTGPSDVSGQEPQAQLQSSVIQLYIFHLRNEVGLSEDQFIKARPVIQRFIRMRFQNASQKTMLDRQRDALLSRPDASDAEIQKLNEAVAKLDGQAGTWDSRMVEGLQMALADQQLSERQIAALGSYNRRFFYERLPNVLDQMRNAPLKGDRPARGNESPANQAARPANTLRGNNTTSPVQPVPPGQQRQKSSR